MARGWPRAALLAAVLLAGTAGCPGGGGSGGRPTVRRIDPGVLVVADGAGTAATDRPAAERLAADACRRDGYPAHRIAALEPGAMTVVCLREPMKAPAAPVAESSGDGVRPDPPDPPDLPRSGIGSGWWCARLRGLSACVRTEENCERLLAGNRPHGDCRFQGRAYCPSPDDEVCFPSPEDCRAYRPDSDCALVR